MAGRSPTKVVLWHVLGVLLTFFVAYWLRTDLPRTRPRSSRLSPSHLRVAGFRFCRADSRPFPGHAGSYLADSRRRISTLWRGLVGLRRSLFSIPARFSRCARIGRLSLGGSAACFWRFCFLSRCSSSISFPVRATRKRKSPALCWRSSVSRMWSPPRFAAFHRKLPAIRPLSCPVRSNFCLGIIFFAAVIWYRRRLDSEDTASTAPSTPRLG